MTTGTTAEPKDDLGLCQWPFRYISAPVLMPDRCSDERTPQDLLGPVDTQSTDWPIQTTRWLLPTSFVLLSSLEFSDEAPTSRWCGRDLLLGN